MWCNAHTYPMQIDKDVLPQNFWFYWALFYNTSGMISTKNAIHFIAIISNILTLNNSSYNMSDMKWLLINSKTSFYSHMDANSIHYGFESFVPTRHRPRTVEFEGKFNAVSEFKNEGD